MTAVAPTSLRWPALETVPTAPVHARVARVLFERAVGLVPVRASYPDGRVVGGGGAGSPVFELVNPEAFFARIGKDSKIGFGESFMAGDWRPGPGTDLADLLAPFAAKLSQLIPEWLQRFRSIVDERLPHHEENTLEGSRENIHRHYDLSNDLFAAFLDPTMSYSSAWFEDGDDLETAQLRKIDGMLDYAGVGEGTRVLEIGTGWGALALRAAQRGARVLTITLSEEQAELARERIAAAGMTERVEVRLQDYREVQGQFDAIVSVEMIEAVGEKYWPTYFSTIDRLLAPGGRVAIQSITMAHERMRATRRSYSWIQKYIFPGGIIPSLQAIDETLARHTSLRVAQRRELGWHYAETLKQWRSRFLAEWDHIRTLGFDDTFRSMWEFYLAYCEAGFRTGYLGVSQLQMVRP